MIRQNKTTMLELSYRLPLRGRLPEQQKFSASLKKCSALA